MNKKSSSPDSGGKLTESDIKEKIKHLSQMLANKVRILSLYSQVNNFDLDETMLVLVKAWVALKSKGFMEFRCKMQVCSQLKCSKIFKNNLVNLKIIINGQYNN